LTTVVFTGPSISTQEAARLLPDAIVLGPVGCGDVYRALRHEPTLIAIIDGYFDQRLSVWHKEILWAMSHGVHVCGAASMGALRAAELASFGMHGVGQIFEWFRDEVLADDDEVALTHESADRGYAAVSEPMVNIRATLQCAVEGSSISEATAAALIAAGKQLFYAERRWDILLRTVQLVVPPSELGRLREWLRSGKRVDQKRLDALELIAHIRDMSALARARPRIPSFTFEYTEAWHALRSRLDQERECIPPPASNGK